jgi:hypothetical protein
MINGVFFTFAANKKSVIPKLNEEVHDLNGIKRNGDYDNRLKKAGINTVQKFLKALNEAPEKLRCQVNILYFFFL